MIDPQTPEEVISTRPWSDGDVVAGDELLVEASSVFLIVGSNMEVTRLQEYANGTRQIVVKPKGLV